MLCQEIMKRRVEWVRKEDSVQDAARKMRDAMVGFLPVCDPAGRVVGTVTDRDIAIRLVADDLPTKTPVLDIMSHEVISCRPDDELVEAEQKMGRHQKSRILVLDGASKLVGVISLSDIATHEEDRPAAQTMRQITEREVHS
jgi:CBS domain-containing protein